MTTSPIDTVLSRLADVRQVGEGQWKACCPCHDSRSRQSLSITLADDGKVLLHCFAKCDIKAILGALNLKSSDLFPHEPVVPGATQAAGKKKSKRIYATYEDAARALDVHLGTRVAAWKYEDQNGLVAVIVRWNKGDGKEYRPIARNGDGWNIGDPPGKWPLYRLRDITGSKGIVFVFEGEKATDEGTHLGLNGTTSAHGAKSPPKTDWSPLAGRKVVIVPDNDKSGEGYAQAVARILVRLDPPSLVKIVRLPGLGQGDDIVEFVANRRQEGKSDQAIREEIYALVATASRETEESHFLADNDPKASRSDPRPVIVVGPEEYLVNDAAVEALTRDEGIFQRAGLLVRVVHDDGPREKGIRRESTPIIDALPPAILRERLTANSEWVRIRETKDGPQECRAHPPSWCVSAVHARARWEGMRHLEAVVDYPIIRPDGSILVQPGYDRATGLILASSCSLGTMPDRPNRNDAFQARERLLEAVVDFPFAAPVHRAGWLAGLLTPLARFAFFGPSPLFLVDANIRAAGKGMALNAMSSIIRGRAFTVATYTEDENELRKRITSLAIAGERLVVFDNLTGRFGNGTLDAALTTTSWQDRILGVNKMVKCPLFISWYATGNNIQIGADTARRICHIRLESPEERPEERNDFRHPDLMGWIETNRPQLLAAALTILRSYILAGCPDMHLAAWGSFEGWSKLVRSAVVWAGMEDPGLTQIELQDRADVSAEYMKMLVHGWAQLDPDQKGMTAGAVIEHLRNCKGSKEPEDSLRAAIEGLCGKLDSRALGNKIRHFHRRVFDGRYFDRRGTSHNAARWAVFAKKDFYAAPQATIETPDDLPANPFEGSQGESGESFPTDGRSEFS